jgi:antitoxin component YwqK of YwqJK toxin-antitoxin module
MSYQKPMAMLVVMAMLSGCTSRIEYGQLDYDNGVAYKHGSNDPFTGMVHFGADDPSPFITSSLILLTRNELIPQNPNTSPAVQMNYSCEVSFKNGVPEGGVQCDYGNGKKGFSFALHDGRLSGEGVVRNMNGDTIFVTHWKDGAYDGEQKMYSLDGSHVVHEWSVEDGHKRGKEYWAYNNGDDLAEGKWGDDGQFTGTMFVPDDRAVYTLKDGVKDGDFKQLDFEDQNLKRVAVEGNYGNGQREGAWTFHGREAMNHAEQFEFSSREPGLSTLMGVPQGDTAMVTWKDGVTSSPH